MLKTTQNLSAHAPYKGAAEDAAAKDNGQVNPKQTLTASYAVQLQREMNYATGAQKHYGSSEPCQQTSDTMVLSQMTFSP